MARFAPIGSLDLLKKLDNKGLCGGYHLLLAHKVLEDPQGWQSFKHQQAHWEQPYIIMDNSLIELGRAMIAADVIRAAEIVGAHCVVLADQLGNMVNTVALSQANAMTLKMVGWDKDILGVVQGADEYEYMKCAEELVKVGCTHLSIPRITVKMLGSRVFITERILNEFKADIHLLGFSDDLVDDLATCALFSNRYTRVIGIDSTEPLRVGLMHQRINKLPRVCPPREQNWLDRTDINITPEMEWNLNWIRRVIE